VTGKHLVLTGSAASLAEAKEIRRRLLVEVDEERYARTRATFGNALEKWLRVHEMDDSTRESTSDTRRCTSIPSSAPLGRGDYRRDAGGV